MQLCLQMTISAVLINAKNHEPLSAFYNTTMNFCKLSQGFTGNFLVQIFIQDMIKYSNLSPTCPVKKLSYIQYEI